MSVVHLGRWDPTAIEISMDLEVPSLGDPSSYGFSGPAQPRICLVAAFALTSQLKRIVAAVDRVLPARLPPLLRIAPSRTRAPSSSAVGPVSIRPMPPLIRIQSRLIRAMAPGLASPDSRARDMSEAVSHYIREFIPSNALPTLEPSDANLKFVPTQFRTFGVTMYRLDRAGNPQSILGHWTYAPSACRSDPLRSGP